MNKRKFWGLLFTAMPLLCLAVVVAVAGILMLFFVVLTSLGIDVNVLLQTDPAGDALAQAAFLILGLSILLSLLMAILGALAIFTAVPVGIYFLATAKSHALTGYKKRPLHNLTVLFMGLAWLTAICDVLVVPIAVMYYKELSGFPGTTIVTEASFSWGIYFWSVAIVQPLLFLVAASVFLFWIGRLVRNLSLAGKVKHAPDWVVWGHLIPVYNYFHPLIVLPDVWRDVGRYAQLSGERQAKGLRLLSIWTVFWLIFGAMSFFGNTAVEGSLMTVSALKGLLVLTLVSVVPSIGATIVFIKFVEMVDEAMEKK